MKILKASAGSGKTYHLSKHYVELLLKDGAPDRHRHILAVTFTNKATAEMKNRILEDLAKLAKTDPRAKRRLTELLHDYGAFSVSTIDRFFQRTLKAFSRELGQFADYQIELDKEALILETMDRILDSLTEEDTQLLKWIRSALEETLSQGDRFSLDAGLKEVGLLLKNDEHRDLVQRYGISETEAFGKERLERIRRECREVIRDFTERARTLGFPVEKGKIISPKNKIRVIRANPGLEELFEEASYRPYCTAFILDRMLFQLGFAGEFYRAFDALLREKNLMCLDESNTLLRKIIPNKVRIACYIVVIASFVTMVDLLLKAFVPALSKSLGLFIPLIVVNCIILGRAEGFASKNGIGASALDGIFQGFGNMVALTIMCVIREFLGAGTFGGGLLNGGKGIQILPPDTVALGMILPVGGFLTLGVVIAAVQYFMNKPKKTKEVAK